MWHFYEIEMPTVFRIKEYKIGKHMVRRNYDISFFQ